MTKIIPHLWYSDKAEEAARFYASLIPNSRVDSVIALPADTPSGPEGSVQVIEFTLAGQPFMAINAGPLDSFNHAISFLINCDRRRKSTGSGARCPKAARSSGAAGSRIATGCRGRSFRARSAR
jgi:predicted 3-demethylubiquinone-9 3-methyltransferase (glyoxalase superfamily)